MFRISSCIYYNVYLILYCINKCVFSNCNSLTLDIQILSVRLVNSAKRNRLDCLGYLLHLEYDAALSLVSAPPVSSGDSDEPQMILG
jgi:hypothetical protein